MSILSAALLGKELSHSVSPILHWELFKILVSKFSSNFTGIEYDLVECPEVTDVAQWMATAGARGFNGANVTYPYKANAFSLADRRVGVSSAIDSANCLHFTGKEIECASTDGTGLLHSILREYPLFDLERYHLVVAGAGNAARASVYSLCTKWMPKSLTILDRSIARAEELAEFCIAQSPGPTVRVMSFHDYIHAATEPRYRLVMQCTPVGQINHPGDLMTGFTWHETDFAVDLIYNPVRTTFLQSASLAGAKTLGGVGMLIEQAVLSQTFWLTGFLPDGSPLSQTEYDSVKEFLIHSLNP